MVTILTTDSPEFKELKCMFEETMNTLKVYAAEQAELKSRKLLFTAKEVAVMTGYDEKTIKRKKNEIGFRIGFSYQDLKFKYEDVIAWINRGYIPPKPVKRK